MIPKPGIKVTVQVGGGNVKSFQMTTGMQLNLQQCLETGLYGANEAEAVERLIAQGFPEFIVTRYQGGCKRKSC